jgi:hypothetical protein
MVFDTQALTLFGCLGGAHFIAVLGPFLRRHELTAVDGLGGATQLLSGGF